MLAAPAEGGVEAEVGLLEGVPGEAGGELEHLFVTDAIDLSRARADVRVGREDALDVRVNLADVGAGRGAE